MSSIDEKLQNFNDLILKEAAAQRDRILRQIREENEALIESKRKDFEEQAAEMLRRELYNIEREKNNIISKALVESRQLLMKTREGIINSVFDYLKEELETFTQSDAYAQYLKEDIRNSCRLAGEGKLVVYLSGADTDRYSSLLNELLKEFPRIEMFEPAAEDVIGGCRVVNRSSNILVDNTFAKKLELNRDSFFEISGLRID